ncbi:acetolactate decarboxylase [Streptomyces sp. DvalAA-14]|uniref:acetolactate decarboxylase n=1 Tax=unclassified Streptomyces TaxID=2593676 RepID=UPI00081AFB5C|nr:MULTISPECIES: acetolactate decarboxylase [unclassified Streptomyces]MYS19505.1 acetolactate decarboxylase [Streptomyces sp. SID4948]SCD46036.1 acetolactate decarboxylase [Streptomyces sp. DvalAA-14]
MGAAESAHQRFDRWARTMLAHHSAGAAGRDGSRAREVYQTSTMGALLDGVYDGDVTVAELLTHGDFGLGTFNRLDGEMVVLDGICHHVRADGSASVAAPTDRTPFAAVTRFSADVTIPVPSGAGRDEAAALIDRAVPSANLLYGVRVTGTFSRVRTRTVAEQTPPYPPLTQATAGQAETDFSDVRGTLAGFRTPDFEQGISVAGYHLHFLDSAHQHGGHALDWRLDRGEIAVSTASELHLSLPRSGPFLDSDLSPVDSRAQIRKAEGG